MYSIGNVNFNFNVIYKNKAKSSAPSTPSSDNFALGKGRVKSSEPVDIYLVNPNSETD